MAASESVRRFELGLSWRAIFLGLIVGLSAQFLLTLLGMAIGLLAIDVSSAGVNTRVVGFGAGVWALFVPIISWFFGAYAASYASGVCDRAVGVLHGMATWGLGLVVVLCLLSSGVSGAFSASFGTIGAAAQTLSQSGLVQRSDVQQLQADIRQQGEQTTRLTPRDAQQAAHNVAKGAWAAFATALLSFGAACLGGTAGCRLLMERLGLVAPRYAEKRGRPPMIQAPRTT